MAEFPALPLWTDAYLGDTRHLTLAEHGAYLLLLMVAWRSPDCALPNDEKFLARSIGDTRNWSRVRHSVMALWHLGDDNKWRQKRLHDEYKFVHTRATLARASANSRWLKEKKTRHANASFPQCERNAPTPTPIQEEDSKQIIDVLKYTFCGKVIKLVKVDYETWKKRFPALRDTLDGFLEARDAWLVTRPKEEQDKWFISTSAWLAKKNAEIAAKNPPRKRNPAFGTEEWKRQRREAGLDD